ncbi:MAG: ABC transporter permease subunit, partial [Actinomycetales bacterium]
LHAVIGTLYVVLLATIISTPIGFLTSLYIVEVKGRFASTVRFFVQAMSGVPSIVAGLFIYAVWMIGLGNSYNSAAGAGALAILMIPTVARTSEEVLKLIPNDLREAGLALGATQWRTVAMIILPA